MSQKRTHTWDIVVDYHRCPTCGFIIESRDKYVYRMGKYVKDMECLRCHHTFSLTKPLHSRLGPLIGEPQCPEVTWD